MAHQDALRRFRRNASAKWGLGVVIAIVLFALLGPLVTSQDPNLSDFSLIRAPGGAPPAATSAHWLGTDPLLRDMLARLAHGTRLSLFIATLATLLSIAVGAAVGVVAGFVAAGPLRAVDTVLMRLVDVLLAFPFLLLVTAVGVAVGRTDAVSILLVLGLTGWTGTARLVRAKTLGIREQGFVLAARALGAGSSSVIVRHILPNVAPILIVLGTTSIAQMVLAEAVLGYLTMGVPPPNASLGRMLHEAEPYLVTRPLLVVLPGFVILLLVLSFTRLGEGVRDALDPRAARPPARAFPLDFALAVALVVLAWAAKPEGVRPPIGHVPVVERPTRGGTLRLATYVGVRTLDPALAYDEAATAIEELVFSRLVTWAPDGSIVPDLASAITVSPDGTTYEFELRRGVRFHDGARLYAADVKRSIERTLAPSTPCPAANSYRMIAGYDAFRGGSSPGLSGVRVLGDHRLAVQLVAPDATFLPVMTLAFAAPVCASMGTQVDTRSHATPCGTGPFRVERSDPEAGIRLVRHEGYHLPDRPYLDAIEWTTNVRPTSQRYKFEAGELDYLRELSGTDGALFRADPAWSGLGRWTTKRAVNAIFMNTEMAPFDRRAMRRAVAYAIDPSALERVRPDVRENDRVLPDSIPGPPRTERLRRHDLAAALGEMARAGYPFDPATGRGGYPHEIDYLTLPDTFEQQSAEVYQQQLARIGVRIRLRLVNFATYLAEASRRRTTPMGWCGWGADFPDPANFFEPNLSSEAIADEGSQNYAFFSSARLDQVLRSAHAESDHARRMALYQEAEGIVHDEAPWAPTYVTQVFELWQPYLRGTSPSGAVGPPLRDVWLDRGGGRARLERARLGFGPTPASIAFAPFGGTRR
jgi:ABC-type dipeptide/oligopeptide/nickel transport system permease subunit/ABC-type transport system substrate-binding protein